jgi:biotin operon repressor
MSTRLLLPPSLAALLQLLVSERVVTPEMIRQRLDLKHDYKVAIHRLRDLIKDAGLEIHSRRNVGYWIEDQDKSRRVNAGALH